MTTPPVSRTLTLLLVRHGETDWNRQNRWQGGRDIPLNNTGRYQATRLRDRLRASWSDTTPPDSLFSSNLSRAVETAQILRDALPQPLEIRSSPHLRERDFGAWEGLTAAEVRERFGDTTFPPDSETFESAQARIATALREIWHEALVAPERESATALVIGHGGTLRFFLSRALGVGIEAARRFRLGNTSLSCVEFIGAESETAEGHLIFCNDTAHLIGRH